MPCLACYLYFFSLQVLVVGFLLILKVYGIGFTNQLFANIFIDNQPFFAILLIWMSFMLFIILLYKIDTYTHVAMLKYSGEIKMFLNASMACS